MSDYPSWYEHGTIEDADWWHEEHKCKQCGTTDASFLYKGYCDDCLSELYDRYEPFLYRYFKEYEEYLYDETDTPLDSLWVESERDRNRNKWGASRSFLKEFTLEDPWVFADWLDREGYI